MITKGKAIITAPDGKRYVITGANVRIMELYGVMHLFVIGKGCSAKLNLREIKRDANGRRFKK